MPPPSAYELLASGQRKPIQLLESHSVSEKELFDIKKLGRILVSFGDFKDTGYRLKIRKDQAEAIQAIGFILERYHPSPAQQQLAKRSRRSGGTGDSEGRDRKRPKTR